MSQPEDSDEELLQRAGRGDARAFEQLYERHSPRLYGLLKSMLPEARDTEEVMLEASVQLWEQASSYQVERGSAFAWAVGVYRKKAIERMRVLGRRGRLHDAAALENMQFKTGEATSGRGAEVAEALGKLSREERQLVEPAFLKGLTHHVLSDSLGQPLETVKSTVRHGLLKLRDLLKGAA